MTWSRIPVGAQHSTIDMGARHGLDWNPGWSPALYY